MEKKTITVIDNRTGKKYEFSIKDGTCGPNVVDLSTFYNKTGMFVYDPGFTSTASCQSKITYIDGDKGHLLHRGYSIEDLAENSDYPEVCYLLLNGELPDEIKKKKFTKLLTFHTMLHEQILSFYSGFRRDSHPMAVMVGIVGALSSFYSEKTHNFSSNEGQWVAVSRLLAKMPTIAAMAYKYSLGQPFIYPKNDTSSCTKENLTFSENIKEFEKLKINLFGLSKDSIESHLKFTNKYKLEVELISDPDIHLIKQLGSWVKKSMYGKEYMGVERSTFLIDEDNIILEIWRKVKVNGHVQNVLDICNKK